MRDIWGRILQVCRIRPICALCSLWIATLTIVRIIYGYDPRPVAYDLADGEYIYIEGVIKDYTYLNIFNERTLVADIGDITGVGPDGKPLRRYGGSELKVKAYFDDEHILRLGYRVRIKGKVSGFKRATCPGQFDAYAYYCGRGYLFELKDADIIAVSRSFNAFTQAAHDIAVRGENILDRYLDKDDSGVVKAMLFGNKTDLNQDLKELYRKNGIAHILAISGLHISFLAMLLYRTLGKMYVSIKSRVILCESAIIFYGIMVGFSPSAFRAICMFSVFLISKALKRTYDMLSAIATALVVLLTYRPTLMEDPGLALSFTAILGVGFYHAGFVKSIVNFEEKLTPLSVSFFVFLSTLPVMLCSYYEVSLFSIFLNVLVVPLMSVLLIAAVMLITIGAFFTGSFADIATFLPVKVIELILFVYERSCELISASGLFKYAPGHPYMWQIVIYYILITLAVLYKGKRRAIISTACIAFSFLLFLIRPYFGMDIMMLDIGQGDCMVIRYSESIFDKTNVYMIDCGSSSVKSPGEKRLVPALKYYGIRSIEGIFITHPDSDHVNGIAELTSLSKKEGIRVDKIYIFDGFIDHEGLTDLIDKPVAVSRGMRIEDGKMTIKVLYPYVGCDISDVNEASLIMDVSYKDFHMITTGDAQSVSEKYLVDHYNRPEYSYAVIKVPHHGSDTSSTEEFLGWADPGIALISCGRNNIYGHPDPEVLKRYENAGADIYRTDTMGTLLLHTDGSKVKVDTYFK